MNISQYPKPEQIAALIASTETGPVVMVNLLKFKDRADAPRRRDQRHGGVREVRESDGRRSSKAAAVA